MATREVGGVVSTTSAKPWNGKNGPITLYSFQIEGERGWFRTGTTKPDFGEGDAIRFIVDTTTGNVELASIVKSEGTPPTRAPRANGNSERNSGTFPRKSSGSGYAAKAQAKDDYWTEKDKYYKEVEVPRITYSACQSRAIEVVKMALQHEALPLPAAKGKKLEALLGMVDEITERFVRQINDLNGMLPKGAQRPETDDPEKPFEDEIPFGDEEENTQQWGD